MRFTEDRCNDKQLTLCLEFIVANSRSVAKSTKESYKDATLYLNKFRSEKLQQHMLRNLSLTVQVLKAKSFLIQLYYVTWTD